MSFYVEPVYLNEKMVLNCAAYIFKGVALESEISEGKVAKNKGNLSIGFKFLQDLLSPISASAEQEKEKTIATKTARRYTLGGLHMSLIDALNENGFLSRTLDIESINSHENYVEMNVILKPIDFYSIIEALKVATPLISQMLQNFGDKFNSQVFTKNMKADLAKYEQLVTKILSELENDYLKSGQLEMIMVHPETNRQLGVVDIDVSDLEPLAVKAKLTDGRFKVIGRISRHVGSTENISLVQRTVLSSALAIIEKLVTVSSGIDKYRQGMSAARIIAQQVCQLTLPGPAVRVMAMSVCI
ncbi:DUF6414 family protein [Undibacterium squillarum]|uniref:Uncharacterized protein n=1 Tax=Undibacterium squillarum TaxID=1131567 RepID=A0ABQ2Y0R9_9BURK|nr:hypothetical protein [Undibacterium squillarum]GGX47758.1 hypothetical protein GCM10010946_27830 [Undibacterium squillarum]